MPKKEKIVMTGIAHNINCLHKKGDKIDMKEEFLYQL